MTKDEKEATPPQVEKRTIQEMGTSPFLYLPKEMCEAIGLAKGGNAFIVLNENEGKLEIYAEATFVKTFRAGLSIGTEGEVRKG